MCVIVPNALAMTFSQPVEIGWMGMSPKGGGFTCKNELSNNGDYYTVYIKNNRYSFGKGIAQFGNKKNILYVYYNVYKNGGKVKIGGKNVTNTVEFPIINEWIYEINSDTGIILYPIRNWYGPDSEWRIVGTRKDGNFVLYINTMDITRRYFGLDVRNGGSPIQYDIPSCYGDTVIIKYKHAAKRDFIGEFRFKWDDKAQWFGIEQVVY